MPRNYNFRLSERDIEIIDDHGKVMKFKNRTEALKDIIKRFDQHKTIIHTPRKKSAYDYRRNDEVKRPEWLVCNSASDYREEKGKFPTVYCSKARMRVMAESCLSCEHNK